MGKYNLSKLTEDEKEQLKDYVNSIKEIKKAITEILSKVSNQYESEEGGNQSTDKILNI